VASVSVTSWAWGEIRRCIPPACPFASLDVLFMWVLPGHVPGAGPFAETLDVAPFVAPVGATHDYTPVQLEELAKTLYIHTDGGHNAYVRDSRTPAGHVSVTPPLIDAAVAEIQIERKRRLGFHAG